MTERPADLPVVHETPDQIAAERRGLIRLFNPFGRIWLRVVARLLEWSTKLIPSQLNLTWITPDLAVGGAPRKRDYRRLAAMGVTAVVDCRDEAQDDSQALEKLGIRLLHLPTEDGFALSQEQLLGGARWSLDELAEGGKVFAHCQHGVGRAPLLGSAVLIGQGLSAPEALRTVRTRRWQAAPNDRQIEALLVFEERWEGEETTNGSTPSASAASPQSTFLSRDPA